MISDQTAQRIRAICCSGGGITLLTGAGISAESGIPTFRGPEGYWRVGASVYQPQEISSFAMYRQRPQEVWRWFLYRRGVCRRAAPNLGHHAIVTMEALFAERFTLITQNVDGLHLRAGSSPGRTFQIHGNLDYMRCGVECCAAVLALPEALQLPDREAPLTDEQWQQLRCPRCGSAARPHVLWFDECYDERHYRFESSLASAYQTQLLIIVGTSGATNLPNLVAEIVASNGGFILDINPEPNRFSLLAQELGPKRGAALQGTSSQVLPPLLALMQQTF